MSFVLSWLREFASFIVPRPLAVSVPAKDVPVEKPTPAVHVANPTPAVNQVATLVSIIMSVTRDFGPSLKTGGQIRKVNAAQAETIAQLILAEAKTSGIDAAMLAAGIAGESCFDPTAVNPNNQDAKKGESAHEAFLHKDIGLCQFDAATIIARPEMHGLTDEQVEAKALEPQWAVPAFAQFVHTLLADTEKEVAADATILTHVPNKDPRVLATLAYNHGLHGALNIARENGDFAYGVSWMARYTQYAALLKGPTG